MNRFILFLIILILPSCASFPDGQRHGSISNLWRKDVAVEIVQKSVTETYFIGFGTSFTAEVLPDGGAKVTCQEIKETSSIIDWFKNATGIVGRAAVARAGRDKTVNKSISIQRD